MARPRLLDLFCSAGGASRGYQLAGFDVTGVDIEPQPRYAGDRFIRDNAMDVLLDRAFLDQFQVVTGSPPCQGYSQMSDCRPGLAGAYAQLVDSTRTLLQAWGGTWVIENVAGSGLATQPDVFGANGLLLCGAMFGAEMYRHRLFESSHPLTAPPHPRHLVPTSPAGHWTPGTYVSVAGNCAPIAMARKAMGIDWMTRDELAEAIPPAYTRHIGEQMLAHLAVGASA